MSMIEGLRPIAPSSCLFVNKNSQREGDAEKNGEECRCRVTCNNEITKFVFIQGIMPDVLSRGSLQLLFTLHFVPCRIFPARNDYLKTLLIFHGISISVHLRKQTFFILFRNRVQTIKTRS